jgi:hypothetical protein
MALEGAAYLKSSEGVRSSAMAGAFSAVPGSAEALWYNPAGLSGLRGAEMSLTHQTLDSAFDSDHIVAAAFLGWQSSLGLLYSRKGALDSYRDSQANSAGSFEVSNTVMGLGYSYDMGWASLGLGAKFLSEKVDKLSGSSTVYDAGLSGSISKDRVLYGVSLLNYGPAPSLGNPGADFQAPMTLRAGLGWKAGDPSQALLLVGDYKGLLNSGVSSFALGAEYSEIYDDNSLALRAGWDFGQNQLGGASGLSLGLGFGYKFLSVDYTWLPLDVLGSSHRIALTLTYDQKAEAQEKSISDYLGINPQAQILPSPTPAAARPIRRGKEKNVGAELEALLAASPTPMQSPTPVILEKAKEKPKGIFGAIFSIFGFGSKEEKTEEAEQPKRKGGLLKGFFNIFGISSDEDKPAEVPEQPGQPANPEDQFVAPHSGAAPAPTPVPGQPTPTVQPTPVIQKMKGWLSF